jgi:hypothetical protein
VDGEIDVPVGDEEGSRLKIGFDLALGVLDLGLFWEKSEYDGMDSTEAYPSFYALSLEDPESPLLLMYGPSAIGVAEEQRLYTNIGSVEQAVFYQHSPLPERRFDILEVDLSSVLMGVNLGVDVDVMDRTWDYSYSDSVFEDGDISAVRISPRLRGDLFQERLSYDLTYDVSGDLMHGRMPSVYDRTTLLFKGDLDLANDWSIYYNLRHASYEWTEDGEGLDDSFFNTHLALVWSPIPRIELRLGYGLNPIYYRDTPVEGREIGRERYISSYLWENPAATLIRGEEALEDLDIVTLMRVIAF